MGIELLDSWDCGVRIPLRTWMFLVFVVCYVGSSLEDGLITRPEESLHACNFV